MQNKEWLKDRISKSLTSAIVIMRAHLDDAERRSKDADSSRAIQQTLHSLTWGFANANASIENAMSALQDLNNFEYEGLQQELEAVEQNLRDRT